MSNNRHTPDDIIFDIEVRMKQEIRKLLEAFTYHDSDPLYSIPGDKPNETQQYFDKEARRDGVIR